MGRNGRISVILGLTIATFVIFILCLICFYRKKLAKDEEMGGVEDREGEEEVGEVEKEDLMCFEGGEKLTIHDILDAPGEIVGKCRYGTLYKANLDKISSIALLRFLRPAACSGRNKEIVGVIRMLGVIRHPNLVPLQAFYSGPRGEKLLVHPFYSRATLDQFVRDPLSLNRVRFLVPSTFHVWNQGGNHASHKWAVIYKISTGIVKAMVHLHTGLQKPLIHGNLKSRNILLDGKYEPYVSDFCLYLLLNPTTGQEMLEASGSQGYKAPELIKMREASVESDIYNLRIILLEIITGRPPINDNPSPNQDRYLPDSMKNVTINHRISDIIHPDLLLNESGNQKLPMEERLLMFVQLALACCFPSPVLRPHIKEVLKKIEEIGQ